MQYVVADTWRGAVQGRPMLVLRAGTVVDEEHVDVQELRDAGVPLAPLTPALAAVLGDWIAQANQGRALPPEMGAFLLTSAAGAGAAGYSPSNPSDWYAITGGQSVPQTVGEALDAIAAFMAQMSGQGGGQGGGQPAP